MNKLTRWIDGHRTTIAVMMLLALVLVLAGCSQASIVSSNISKEADAFNVVRRITVMNARSDKILFEMMGTISLQDSSDKQELHVIVRTGPDSYKKHFIRLNQWVLYVVEDISGAEVSPYHYEINFLPEMLLPVTFTSERGTYSEEQILERAGEEVVIDGR